MKILLTHGYELAADRKERTIMKPYPPLGLLYVAAWLREHGYRPEVFDTTFRSLEELVTQIAEEPCDILGVYTNLMTRPTVVALIREIRSRRAADSPRIVLGGPEVTAHVDRFLEAGADVIVIGEGEETMLAVVRAFEEGSDLAEVDGIAFRREDGTTHRTGPRELIRPLDRLPFPARDLIDLHRYLEAWKRAHGRSAMSINTMRGCPYTCRWCSRAVYGSSYRRRPVAQVVDEILELRQEYRPDTLWFVDDVFTISPKWLRAFAEEVTRRDAGIPYECITRADRMDEETIDLLVASGCFRVWIGAESGSQRIIDAMDRRVSVERVREMMLRSREKGLETGTFIMLGYPGEEIADILETVEHLKACRADHYTVTTTYPIAGTPLHEEISGRLTVTPEWAGSTDRDLRFERTYPERFYSHALRYLTAEVERDRVGRAGGSRLKQGKLWIKGTLSRWAMERGVRSS